MIRIATADSRARTYVWDKNAGTNPKACLLEYWPATSRSPAEVNYFAGGPSSCTWIIPYYE